MTAAHRGLVVAVNVHADRCDAFILRSSCNEVAYVPLPDLSSTGVAHLYELMLKTLNAKGLLERTMSRLKGPPGDHFEEILTALWGKLVDPILEFLGYKVGSL